MVFNEDNASRRTQRMWLKLGGQFEKAAYDYAQEQHERAIKCARMADVCFWQASGVMDSLQMKDVVS